MEETLGVKIIGQFGVRDSEQVGAIKVAAANLIDAINDNCPNSSRKSRAISMIEDAQMKAVKSLFAEDYTHLLKGE